MMIFGLIVVFLFYVVAIICFVGLIAILFSRDAEGERHVALLPLCVGFTFVVLTLPIQTSYQILDVGKTKIKTEDGIVFVGTDKSVILDTSLEVYQNPDSYKMTRQDDLNVWGQTLRSEYKIVKNEVVK